MKESWQTRIRVTVQAVGVTVVFIVIRQTLYAALHIFNLPLALTPLITWLLLFLILWVPRPVFYMPLFVSEAISYYSIIQYASTKGNAIVGTTLNFVLIVLLAETFKRFITRQKKVNEKLKQEKKRADAAVQQKDIFLAKMSHELRTPLNGIKGITELLLDSSECREKESHLTMIKDAADTLQYLIDDLLDLSKIDAGIVTLSSRVFQLKPFLRNVVKQFDIQVSQKDLTLETEVSDDLPDQVCMDCHRLRQIYTNLLSNAIKYTPGGGVIRFSAGSIRCKNQEPGLRVTVSDTGEGIPDAEKELIYNSFYRAIDTYHNKTSGVGLGLYIVKRHVELFDGTISVESTLGKGSTFVVDLPLVVAENIPDKTKQQEEAGELMAEYIDSGDGECLKVLAAEDNAINSFYLASLVEKYGHTITVVDNGEDAVESYKNNHYDLVLMDIQMPGISGIEAISRIRQYEEEMRKEPIYIAAITAYATEHERGRIESAVDAYVSKPIESERLVSILKAVQHNKLE